MCYNNPNLVLINFSLGQTMQKRQNVLLVLDETERSMVVEALYNDVHYSFPHYLFKKTHQQYHKNNTQLLDKLNTKSGGFRLRTTADSIYSICYALRWNSKFILSEEERHNMEKMDEYTELSYILEGRNKNIHLFSDFNPKQYLLNTQVKPFRKFDFTQNRILLIRFEGGEMEFIREFYRDVNENDKQYNKRAEKAVVVANRECLERIKYNERFLDMKYQAVSFTDLVNHKLKKDYSYHY